MLDGRVRAEREALSEQIRLLEERLRALDRTLAEREGLPPAARALAEEGERIALSLLEVEPGSERAVAAALGRRASAVVRDDAAGALELLSGRDAGLGSARRPRRPRPGAARGQMPVVGEGLLSTRLPAGRRKASGTTRLAPELWFAGETAGSAMAAGAAASAHG